MIHFLYLHDAIVTTVSIDLMYGEGLNLFRPVDEVFELVSRFPLLPQRIE